MVKYRCSEMVKEVPVYDGDRTNLNALIELTKVLIPGEIVIVEVSKEEGKCFP